MNPFVLMAAVQSLESVANFFISDLNSRRQVAFQEKMGREMAEAVAVDLTSKYDAMGRQSNINDREAARQAQELVRQVRQRQAEVQGGAAMGGVQGTALDEALTDFEQQELLRLAVIRETRDIQRINAQQQRVAFADQGWQAIRQATGGPVARPSAIGALFQIAGSVASADAQASNYNAQSEKFVGGIF